MRVNLTNDFHRSSVTLDLKSAFPTDGQVKRAWRTLCGIKGCTCGGNIMGMHGPQSGFRIVGQEYSRGGLVPRFAPIEIEGFRLDNTEGFTQAECDLLNEALRALMMADGTLDESNASDIVNNNWRVGGINTVESLTVR